MKLSFYEKKYFEIFKNVFLILYFRDHLLSDGEAKAMIERVRIEMQETKQKMDGERQRQEEELHKKLSDRKLKRMEEMVCIFKIN